MPPRRRMGGPMGGPMGPRFNRPFPHFDYNIPSAPRQNAIPGGTSIVATFNKMNINAAETFKQAKIRTGSRVLGTLVGLRILTFGGIRNQLFVGRMSMIDMQVAEGRLTENQGKKRKMDAAKKYNRYLLKTGFINRAEYSYGMEKFAEKIGVRYVDDTRDQEIEEEQRRHTR